MEEVSLIAPLRRVDQLVTKDSSTVTGHLFQHIPFTTSDLLNWKLHCGPFSEKPTKIANLVKTIVDTHNPTWQDLQQLMEMLFNPEEREKIRNAVVKILKPKKPSTSSLEHWVEINFPSTDRKWNPYNSTDMEYIRQYQTLVVEAVQAAGRPAINMSKPSLVMQEANESPEAFYTCLIKTYQMYTSIDPTHPENAQMLTMAFISQSAPIYIGSYNDWREP